MKNITVRTLATLVCFVSAINSYSQVHSDSRAMIYQDQTSGGYFQFGAGPSWQQNMTLRDVDVPGGGKMTFKTGVRVDLASGFRQDAWAVEFQTGVIYNQVRSFGNDSMESFSPGLDLYQIPVMVNGYYYLPFRGPVTGYVGAGVGGVVGSLRGANFFTDNTYETTFAYQGLAGVNWQISRACALDVGYRFLGTTDHSFWGFIRTSGTLNHSVLATVRFSF